MKWTEKTVQVSNFGGEKKAKKRGNFEATNVCNTELRWAFHWIYGNYCFGIQCFQKIS